MTKRYISTASSLQFAVNYDSVDNCDINKSKLKQLLAFFNNIDVVSFEYS